MAGFDNDDFSLSGLTQQGHELDVAVISSSSDDDDNYGGFLECAQKLGGGEISDKISSLEGGMQPGVKPNASSFLISKIINTVPITPNSIASAISQSDESIHVSFIHFNVKSKEGLWAFIHGKSRFSGLQSPLGITNGNRSHNKPLELI